MIKNKLIIFIILVLAMLSIGVASAEDYSSLNTTDTQDSVVSVSDESNLDLNTEEVTTVSEVDNSNVVSSKEDGSDENLQLQSYGNNDVIKENNGVKTFTDLQSEIDNASDNGTLYLDCDYKYDESASKFAGITINKNNFTIDGQGHTIDANKGTKTSIFTVNGGSLTLKNLILTNATLTAINIGGSANLTINNCTFTNNYGSYGGILKMPNYNFVGTVMIGNSTFTNNSANNGGIIYTAMSKPNYTILIGNSTFTNNSAKHGGIFYDSTMDTILVSNCTFVGNVATSSDTSICGANDGADLRFINCTFENNGGDKGLISGVNKDYAKLDLNLTNCIFRNNDVIKSYLIRNYGTNIIVNSSFINNDCNQLYAVSDTLYMYNSSFINNSATSDSLPSLVYTTTQKAKTFVINNTNFINNLNFWLVWSYYGQGFVNYCNFINNTNECSE